MKGRKRKSLASNIGRRSGLDVVSRKRIRAEEDGTHMFDDYWTDSDPEISKITNTSVEKVVTNKEVEEAARKSPSDALDVHKRTFDDEFSTFFPDQRDKRVSKAREWLSASFAGSAKSFGKRITPKISKDKAVNTSLNKSERSVRKDHCNVTFQLHPSVEKLKSEREAQIDVSSKNISKNFLTSNSIENLNRNAILSDSTKDIRQIIQIQKNYTEKSDSDTSTVEEFPLIQRSKYVTSENDQHTGMLTPNKQPLTQNDNDNNDFSEVHMSSVKRTKREKIRIISDCDSDSSSEVSRSMVDVSKSRRHSSIATVPVRESPQIERSFSNVNKTLNTSVKRLQRHKASTPKNEVSYAKSAKQSLIKNNREIVDYSSDSSSEKLPSYEISRIQRHVSLKNNSVNTSAVERQVDESRVCKNLFQSKKVVNRCSEQSPVEGRTITSAKASRQEKSPSKPEQSPITRGRSEMSIEVSVQEKFPSELGRVTRGRSRMSIEASRQEKSPSKPEQSPVRKERPRTNTNNSRQEKSLSKLEQPPLTRGRSRMSIEASRQEKSPSKSVRKGRPRTNTNNSRQEKSLSKLEQLPVRRGRSTISVYELKPEKSSTVPEESSVKRKTPRMSVEQFGSEEYTSEPEQSPVKKNRPRMSTDNLNLEKSKSKIERLPVKRIKTRLPVDEQSGLSQKKSASKVRPSRSGNISNVEIHNKEGPLQIKPSVTRKKRHANSSVKMRQKHASQTHSNLFQFENDSSRLCSKRSPVKRKNGLAMYEQSPFGPEASFIESETSPKKITQVTEDQRNLSRQTKTSAKAKASKNKRAAPVDNYEVQSDLGENSLPIVKRKENKMTVSGKNNRQSHSEKSLKCTISHTHDKQSKDVISNGNTSGPAKGPRRSSRYRVPPLDSWRNERLVFKALPSGDVQCIGIDKGTEEDNHGLLQILRKAKKIKSQKKKLVKTVKSTSILDTKTDGIVHVHRPFESLHWSVPPDEDKKPPPYLIAKAFTSKSMSMSFGFLDVSPFSTKEAQYSPIYNLHFAVIKGIVDVTIHETKFTFEKGDSFIVPVGAPYSLKNCSSARALLSFSTFKEPFYPHQIAG
ncbi:CENP-C_C domain-containing protein [Trichonephila clavata]|uniref:CENP-C_C domain-containing protein n=1 Tax=Trichonephila clavata TaxID=2740835 RepID=A0A8X6JJQ5_TRICU|nr:CENP-C_C domain-containing protein [Trichonephila clavata]